MDVRGWWRPIVTFGAVILGALAYLGTQGGPPDFAPLVTILLFASLMPAFIVWHTGFAPARFLRGLRDAGVDVEIVDQEMGWLGSRTVRAQSASGEWRLWSTGGKAPRLEVRGPAMRRRLVVRGNPRRAGREAAEAGALAPGTRYGPFE